MECGSRRMAPPPAGDDTDGATSSVDDGVDETNLRAERHCVGQEHDDRADRDHQHRALRPCRVRTQWPAAKRGRGKGEFRETAGCRL